MKNHDHASVIGIDIGGTNMQVGVVAPDDTITGRAAAKTEGAKGIERVLDNVNDGIDRACAEAGIARDELGAVGVAAAGAIDIPNGIVLTSPNLDWHDLPLRALLAGRLRLSVALENDVNGAVWGEYRLGAGKGSGGDALGVWIGTGVGGGLVIGGRIHHGDLFTAGEIGHTTITAHLAAHDVPGPDAPRTNLEHFASRTGMRARIAEGLAAHPESIMHELTGGDPDLVAERIGTGELEAAYQGGDALTVSVVNRGADVLGIAIANCVTLLAIGTVFVGGGITEALGEPYLERIRASFRAHVFPDRCRSCRLVMTTLAADAGLLGAALIAREMMEGSV